MASILRGIEALGVTHGRSNENFPKRTWKGEHANVPSSCSTTITSMAPLRVAGLMEFHVFETEPLILLTYCIVDIERLKLNIHSADDGKDDEGKLRKMGM